MDPPPFYSPERDAVLAWHSATYGPHAWALPRLAVPAADPTQRAAAFAAALLGGRVLAPLGALQQVLVAPAASAGRAELAGLPRVGELLAALQQRQVGGVGVLMWDGGTRA
jgi:ATP-dependent RNA helicase DHX37/DHR1